MPESIDVPVEPEEFRSLDRARFLRLLGAGAGLAMLPTSLAFLAGPAGAQAAASGLPISGEDYPIGIWWPPPPDLPPDPPDKTREEYYAEISAAGFNFVIGGNGVVNDAHNPPALQAASANGLMFLLTDARLRNLIRDGGGTTQTSSLEQSTPSVMQSILGRPGPKLRTAAVSDDDVKQRVQELVANYGGHPALAGINLYDEPNASMFGLVNTAEEELKISAPDELPYVNVWPSYAASGALGTRDYRTYLERFFTGVDPPLLCFDHYPLLKKGITYDYFYNWAVIRNFALDFGVPSWGFVQSVGFDGSDVGLADRRRPNRQEILWQVNVALAYGAKGIQYFTYWTPEAQPAPSIRFGQAMISTTGQQTALYDYASEVNTYLKVVGKILLPLFSESVVHAREQRMPMGAKPFRGDRYVRDVSGSPVILGRFRDVGTSDRYLLVVNRSFANRARTRLTMGGAVSRVSKLNISTGAFDKVRLQGRPRRDLVSTIQPGGARLYLLQKA